MRIAGFDERSHSCCLSVARCLRWYNAFVSSTGAFKRGQTNDSVEATRPTVGDRAISVCGVFVRSILTYPIPLETVASLHVHKRHVSARLNPCVRITSALLLKSRTKWQK